MARKARQNAHQAAAGRSGAARLQNPLSGIARRLAFGKQREPPDGIVRISGLNCARQQDRRQGSAAV